MKYPYMKDADHKLECICEKGICALYKADEQSKALAYLEKELEIIDRQGSASMWIMVFNALEAVDAKDGDYFEGMTTPTMVSYTLGLSRIDPLCVETRLYLEFVYGLHCERIPAIRVDIPENVIDKLEDWFCSYFKNENIDGLYSINRCQFGIIVQDKRRRDYNGLSGYVDDLLLFEFSSVNTSCCEVSYTKINPLPQSHNEWIKWHGICYGYGIRENNAEDLMNGLGVSLCEAIAHPEDIYERLTLYEIDEDMAYEIADYVRKGEAHLYGFTRIMLDEMNKAGVPQEFISSCEKIGCLISRGESVVACYDIEEDAIAHDQLMMLLQEEKV